MTLIAPEAQGRSRPRAEGNKCHTSRVHVLYNITSLYPEGIDTRKSKVERHAQC